jgi:hypothetical protein
MAKRKDQTVSDADYWNPLTLLMPSTFAHAAREAAHRYQMPVPEYCRQALLLRLAADGIRLDDYDQAA